MELDTNTLTLYGAMASGGAGLAWWLSDQFKKLKDSVFVWLQSHEDKDQRRHEENIRQFAELKTKLEIVIRNGNGKH